MANIIINSPEKHAFNHSRERLEEMRRANHSYSKKVQKVGDLTIKEQTTKKGNKVILVEDANTKTNQKDKQKFIDRNLGRETTQNGHGTVVVVGDHE